MEVAAFYDQTSLLCVCAVLPVEVLSMLGRMSGVSCQCHDCSLEYYSPQLEGGGMVVRCFFRVQ